MADSDWGDGCRDAREKERSKMTGKIIEEMRQAKSPRLGEGFYFPLSFEGKSHIAKDS